MNRLKFADEYARYDQYNTFHVSRRPWVQFKTGEIAFTQESPDPEYRKVWLDYGVSVFMPNDSHAPDLYTKEGVRVPAAQFNREGVGNPYLLWDMQHNMVVKLGRCVQETTLAEHLRGFACVWPAPDSKPIVGGGYFRQPAKDEYENAKKIGYCPPNTQTPEEKAYIGQFKGAATFVLSTMYEGAQKVIDDPTVGKHARRPTFAEVQYAISSGIDPMDFVAQYSYKTLVWLKGSDFSYAQLKRNTVWVDYLVAGKP